MADEDQDTSYTRHDARTDRAAAGDGPNVASSRADAQRAEWQDAKRDFARQALAHALTFMTLDNEMVRHSNTIMAAVARAIEEDPHRFLHSAAAAESKLGKLSAEDIVGGQLGGLLGEILDFIKEDKKFFLELIANLLNL